MLHGRDGVGWRVGISCEPALPDGVDRAGGLGWLAEQKVCSQPNVCSSNPCALRQELAGLRPPLQRDPVQTAQQECFGSTLEGFFLLQVSPQGSFLLLTVTFLETPLRPTLASLNACHEEEGGKRPADRVSGLARAGLLVRAAGDRR